MWQKYAGSKLPINLLNVNYIQERIESQSDIYIYTRAQYMMHLFLILELQWSNSLIFTIKFIVRKIIFFNVYTQMYM